MKERSIATSLILSILTCGIYGIYWFITLTDDVVQLSGGKEYNQSGGTAFLLTLITCGIYGIFWVYKIGKSIAVIKNDGRDDSILYLILGIFGFQIIVYCIAQSEVNKAINAKNYVI